MRDFTSCFSEYAVQVSDTSCSSQSSNSCISPAASSSIPSIQNSVTCLYRTVLSTQKKQLLITLTWCKNSLFQGLNVSFGGGGGGNGDDPSSATVKLNTNSRLFRKLKGTKSLQFQAFEIELFWDLSSARYESGPEPVDGYYIFITIDSELALMLGGGAAAAGEVPLKKLLKAGAVTAKFSLISRQEQFSGNALYSTRARFCEAGNAHDIVIRCSDEAGLKSPVMSVCIDKKTVIRVKRLQWNFRGNQTIFVDGLLVDLMWDVHDWFYNNGNGNGNNAVFMFRTRSGMDSRLWLEEKIMAQQQYKDEGDAQDKVGFSLVILACKN